MLLPTFGCKKSGALILVYVFTVILLLFVMKYGFMLDGNRCPGFRQRILLKKGHEIFCDEITTNVFLVVFRL